MAKVACPYCYNLIDQRGLAYQCLGRGVPGGPTKCTKSVDEKRAKLANISVPAYPTFTVQKGLLGTSREAPCPTCLGVTGVRACPVCHTPLSAAFAESRSPLVGVVGGKGAGKSVYLSVLHHELNTAVARTFDADIRPFGDQQGGLSSPRQWLEDYEEALFNKGQLFESTESAAGGQRAPVVIQWRQPRRKLGRETLGTTVLSFYDAAGEDMNSQDRVHTQAYLGVADGLVLLLDPWQLPGASERIAVPENEVREAAPPLEVLGRITELLRTTHKVKDTRKIKVPLAVVFAKMDAFYSVLGPHHPLWTRPPALPSYNETVGADTHEQVRALLHEYGADGIDRLLERNYSRFRYFAVSALGAAPDYAAKQVDKGGVRPFRVEEPLLWLLSDFGAIDRSQS